MQWTAGTCSYRSRSSPGAADAGTNPRRRRTPVRAWWATNPIPPPPPPPGSPKLALGPSRGAAIGLSSDDSRLVVANRDANRDAGTVSIFSVTYAADGRPSLTRVAEVPVCAEPWQVVLHPVRETAYVVCRKDQQVVELTGVMGAAPAKGSEVAVGSEPTSIALTPLGTTAWVTNWVDGTVQSIDTATMKVTTTIDLNKTLAEAGYLGAVAPRAALAHPRSIAITNSQTDLAEIDETLYVTEYFSQQKEKLAADGSNADTARVGLLYKIPLSTLTPSIIELPPMPDMGFKDHDNGTAGCFPNQLQSVTLNGAFGYVTSVCASPKGPMGIFTPPNKACPGGDADCPGASAGSCASGTCATNCTSDADCGPNGGKCNAKNVCLPNVADVKTTVAPAVTIVDLGGNKAIATVSLNKEFWELYESLDTPDDPARRMPLLTNDGAFDTNASTLTAFFTAGGADAVFRVVFDKEYKNGATVVSRGDAKHPFIDLKPDSNDPTKVGQGPVGIAVTHHTHPESTSVSYAFVANDATRNVAVIDLKANEVLGASAKTPVIEVSSTRPTDVVTEGKALFNFGLSRWSLNGQGWGTCAECHAEGLSDNVTWFFARGPRQPLPIHATYAKNPTRQRLLGWNASFDEPSDLESGVLRSTFGGLGLISGNLGRIEIEKIGHGGLNGSSLEAADTSNPLGLPDKCIVDDWAKLVAYLQTVRTPSAPTNLDAAAVTRGRKLFADNDCAGCHGGALWTTSELFYKPYKPPTVNEALKTRSWAQAVTDANFPTSLLPTLTVSKQTMRYNDVSPANFDSLTCALRNVGTFETAEPGVGVVEKRRDMVMAAQGNEVDGKGYSPPSLLGLSVGAPYFHAGNARTLEAALGTAFASHHAALVPGFQPNVQQTSDLVQFLLSLDADAVPVAIPPLGPKGGSFCSAP